MKQDSKNKQSTKKCCEWQKNNVNEYDCGGKENGYERNTPYVLGWSRSLLPEWTRKNSAQNELIRLSDLNNGNPEAGKL